MMQADVVVGTSTAEAPHPSLITICVPTYRRPSLLLNALHSCVRQEFRPIEIDIGDDSPDDAAERVANALDLPQGVTLRYARNRPGVGQAGNVNRLFANARGSRLVLLHDDDVLLPGALAALDAAWRSTPDVVAAYGMQQVIFENGESSESDTEWHNRHANRTPPYCGVRRDLLVCALWRQFPNNGYLVESAVARSVGCRTFAEIGDACDTDFAVRLAIYARGRAFAFIRQTTSQYRMSATGLSQSDNVCWKLFESVSRLSDLAPEERVARDSLLEKIAAQATMENAIHGRPRAALRIFRSRLYWRKHGWLKSAYHLLFIAVPAIRNLRRLAPAAPTGG